MEVVPVTISHPVIAASLLQSPELFIKQCTLMLSLEVVRQTGSLSVAFSCGIMEECQSEIVLAGNCSNGYRQLRQGSGSSARLPAVGPLVVVERWETAVSVWTWTQNYVFFL